MEQVARELMSRADGLTEALAACGVYVERTTVMTAEGCEIPALVVSGTVGRVAFSDRVQRPEQEVVDEQLATYEEEHYASEYKRLRRELGG